MAELKPLQYSDGTDSLTKFLKELKDKHKNQEQIYVEPLIKVVLNFKKFGTRINSESSKNFPPYKTIKGTEFAELRTKKCRYFIYHSGNDVWIGLHGYEKQGNDTPKNEINKAKKEIELWKKMQTR